MQKKKLVLHALVAAACISIQQAHSTTLINYSGTTYSVYNTSVAYTTDPALFQSTPWWGNASLAQALAALYHPGGQTVFVYALQSGSPNVTAGYYYSAGMPPFIPAGVMGAWINDSAAGDYVFGTIYVPGPSATDTNISTSAITSALISPFALQTSKLKSNLLNDCSVFDQRGICVGVAGNYSVMGSNGPENSAAVVYGGYRINDHVRVGAWADQGTSSQTSGTSVVFNNNNPMLGGYVAWTQHPGQSGFGARASFGYGDRNLKLTRDVTGSSEAGTGTSDLTTQGINLEVSYYYPLNHGWVVSPFGGLRYTKTSMAGYTEQTSSGVTAPLTYGTLTNETTTAVLGARFNGRLNAKTSLNATVGIEQDTSSNGGTATVTNSTIGSLNDISVVTATNRTRAFASVGVDYEVKKSQHLGVSLAYQDQAYSKSAVTAAQIKYTIGF